MSLPTRWPAVAPAYAFELTPASISVMTKEFMDDLNVTSLADAMAWTANAWKRGRRQIWTQTRLARWR